MVIRKMVECVECGKRLGFFEGHYHPTLGKKTLVCGSCLLKVEKSVAQWRDFILSNSFNPESSISTLNVDKTSLLKGFIEIKKQFTNDLLISYKINNERRE
jgi:hypothetical protein